MKGFNLAALPASERESVEIQKEACLLVWKLKRHIISRHDVKLKIDSAKSEIREEFRQAINKAMAGLTS